LTSEVFPNVYAICWFADDGDAIFALTTTKQDADTIIKETLEEYKDSVEEDQLSIKPYPLITSEYIRNWRDGVINDHVMVEKIGR